MLFHCKLEGSKHMLHRTVKKSATKPAGDVTTSLNEVHAVGRRECAAQNRFQR